MVYKVTVRFPDDDGKVEEVHIGDFELSILQELFNNGGKMQFYRLAEKLVEKHGWNYNGHILFKTAQNLEKKGLIEFLLEYSPYSCHKTKSGKLTKSCFTFLLTPFGRKVLSSLEKKLSSEKKMIEVS